MAAAAARPGRHPRRRQARQPVPLRVLRRHAPARHDRHGHQLQPRHPHRRRAHHGARRHHPGADHRRHRGDAGALRERRDPHHARPRRGGRDRRQGDGDVRRAAPSSTAPVDEIFYNPHHPYTWGLLGLAAAARRGREDAAHAHQGAAAGPHHAARGLPVRGPLPVRRGQCRDNWPADEIVGPEHGVHCWIPVDERVAIRADLPHFKEPAA